MPKKVLFYLLITFITALAVVFGIFSFYAASAAVISCPIPPQSKRTIITFDGSVLTADSSGLSETSAFASSIPAGTYTIILASYDDHIAGTDTEEYEQWLLVMKNTQGSIIGLSDEIHDLPNNDQYLREQVNADYRITDVITSVTARHTTVYTSGDHDVVPVCVAFDLADNAPLVSTDAMSFVGDHEVMLRGYINPNGSSQAFGWFEWGTSPFLGNKTAETYLATRGSISERITGLQKSAQYYYRAAARNAAGAAYGPILNFQTTPSNPSGTNPYSLPSASPVPSPFLHSYQSTINPIVATKPSAYITAPQPPSFVSQRAILQHGSAQQFTGSGCICAGGTNPYSFTGLQGGFPFQGGPQGVTIGITPSDELLQAGKQVPFRIMFENNTSATLSNVVVMITLPPELVYQSISGISGAFMQHAVYDATTRMLTLSVGFLPSGQKNIIIVETILKSDTPHNKLFTISGEISFADAATHILGTNRVFAVNRAISNREFAAAPSIGSWALWLFLGLLELFIIAMLSVWWKRLRNKKKPLQT